MQMNIINLKSDRFTGGQPKAALLRWKADCLNRALTVRSFTVASVS